MKIGRVVGTVVTPVQHPAYDGRRLLAVRPLDPRRHARPRTACSWPSTASQAGIGDRVLLMAEGSSVRAIVGDDKAPIRCAVVGVIDEVDGQTGAAEPPR